MKTKYTMFRRGAMFYMQDSATGQQTSLRTKDEAEARGMGVTPLREGVTYYLSYPHLPLIVNDPA